MWNPNIVLLFFFTVLSNTVIAQQSILKGIVNNARLEPLAYVTVQIKDLQIGTRTNEKGEFQFQLEEGEYELVFSLIGYKKQSVKFVFRSNDKPQRIILENADNDLGEIKVVGVKKDRATEIIRKVIEQKSKITDAVQSYSVDVYIRATEVLSKSLSEKKMSKLSDSAKLALNDALPNMSMNEISLKLDYEYPNKIKENRVGVKKRGTSEDLFFLHTSDGDFSLYNNLMKLPALSQVPMLSPISYSGLIAYKYKTKNINKKSNYTIYTIQFSPSNLSNALIQGEVDIVDTSWTIVHSKYTMPKYHMVRFNFFEVTQEYGFLNNKAWLPTKQEFVYTNKSGKENSKGKTVVVYDNYKIDTQFAKKYFNKELSTTSLEAYEKDSSFWEVARKEPLSENEVKFIINNDSIQRATNSKPYLDSIDFARNKVTWLRVLFNGQENYNRKQERTIYFAPLISYVRPLMPGGTRVAISGVWDKKFLNKQRVNISAEVNYGIRNKDFQGTLNYFHLYNPFSRGYYRIETGRSFDFIFTGDAFINLFRRSNFYVKNYVNVEHGVELANGLFLRNRVEFAQRQSISYLELGRQFDSIITINNNPIAFDPYNAFYNSVALEYTPSQMYIREPREKIILGSNYPTLYAIWKIGIPNFLKSEVNFNYLEFGFKQKLKLGLGGIMQYQVFSGEFVTSKELKYIDYKFISRGNPFLFNNPLRSFQALDSTFPVFKRFYEGHLMHHFNGAIVNKIPLVKKLKLLEVAGGGFLILPERNLRYAEAYIGIEKIVPLWRERFKFGFYVVTSVANKYNNPFQFKLGIDQFNKARNSWY